MNTERRSHPRAAAISCPHCDGTRLAAHHLRDSGDMDPANAVEAGYCPILAARRRHREAVANLSATRDRLAAVNEAIEALP